MQAANLTFLGDIAGRVARESTNADRVTVAGVSVPSGALKYLRKRLPAALPKWRDATDEAVAHVLELLQKEALGISVISVEKEPDAWANFWRDAADTHSNTASISGGGMSFVKAATLIKFELFARATALSTGITIRRHMLPLPKRPRMSLQIHQSLIFDNEIQGEDNVDAFLDLWHARNKHQPLTNSLGIEERIVRVTLATEQREPLLLLPDYVAGIAHAALSRADTLSSSAVSASAAGRAHVRLKGDEKYVEIAQPFAVKYFDIFPDFKRFSEDAP